MTWLRRLSAGALSLAMILSASAAQPEVVAAAGPQTQPPQVHIKPFGTLGSATVPLAVSWPAATSAGSRIDHYELQLSRDNGPFAGVPLPKALTRAVTVNQRAWSVLTFRVRAVDKSANVGGWATAQPVWMSTAQEDKVMLSGGWRIVSRKAAFGGSRAVTTLSGQTATLNFGGKEVAFISHMGPKAGTIQIAPDGRDPVRLDLTRPRWTNRRVVFTAIFPTAGLHSIDIATETAGASFDVDAFVVLSGPVDATLVGAGDIASCTSTDDSATASVAAGVPGIVFTAGDNVYPDGAAANYTNCYDPSWGILKSRTRPDPGNHDYQNSPGAAGYFGYFGAAAGDPSKGWYKFEAGTWRVYMLNSECTSTTCPQQYSWLSADLAAEPHLCTLAIWHRPRWSTGPHGDAAGLDGIWRLLAANHGDVVINGHDHMYERYTPLAGDGTASANGVREFVVGTGGASLYPFATSSPLIDVRDDTSHGVLRIDLGEGAYSWQFLPSSPGTFTDSGTATCN